MRTVKVVVMKRSTKEGVVPFHMSEEIGQHLSFCLVRHVPSSSCKFDLLACIMYIFLVVCGWIRVLICLYYMEMFLQNLFEVEMDL